MKISRRSLIATSAVGLLGVATKLQASESLPHLAVDDPIAMALGYYPVAEDVDTKRFPKRAGDAGAKQFCDNCSLYKAVNDTHGTCSAIPGKLVAGAGWCNAWIPVPNQG